MTDSVDCCGVPDCATMLCDAINAYHALVTGRKPVEISIDGELTKFHYVSADKLKAHIRVLHQACGNELSAAIVGIPTGGRQAMTVTYGEGHIARTDCGC